MSQQKSSAFSMKSLSSTLKQDELSYYEDMTETELQQAIENIIHLNLILRLENDIFERYLTRREPESLQTITQILETAKRIQKIVPQHIHTSPVISVTGSLINVADKDSVSVASTPSGSRHVTPSLLTVKATGGTKIPYIYRIEMVNTEIRELQKKLENFEQVSSKKKTYLRACIEENQISIREISKNKNEFEEDVIQKGIDSITGKIPAEKFIRFTEEWLKEVNTTIEQIRLKVITIKCQIKKVKVQLKQRKDLGEALRAVDFEQLNIENQIYIRKIDEKNQYLLEMKKVAGHYSIALSKHKERIDGLMSIMQKMIDSISFKKQEIIKLQSKQIAVKIEIGKIEKQLKSVMELIDKYEIPCVITSIKTRIKLQELQKIHKQLSRQRDIQKITFKSQGKQL